MTLDVMANSLVYWTQDLVRAGLLGRGRTDLRHDLGGRPRGLEGVRRGLGGEVARSSRTSVSSPSSSRRSASRRMAIKAGVTDTPALRKIPGNEAIVDERPGAQSRRPPDHARRTSPPAARALSQPGAQWLTGCVVNVDGGEDVAG